MHIQAQIKVSFVMPAILDKDFLSEKKPITRALLTLGAMADNYLSLSKRSLKVSTMETLETQGHLWKTALKVTTYILTALILPALAFVGKLLYKNWIEKNLSSLQNLKPVDVEEIEQDEQTIRVEEIQETEEEKRIKALEKAKKEKIQQINRSFILENNLEKKDDTAVRNELEKIANLVTQLQDDLKLTFKDNELCLRKRAKIQGNKFGEASVQALEKVIEGLKKALDCHILEIELNEKTVSIDQILEQIKKSKSKYVLENNKTLDETFNELIKTNEQLHNDLVDFQIQNIQNLEENLAYFFPQEKEEKNKLSLIRRALPISQILIESVLSKSCPFEIPLKMQEYRKNFPYLTNKALINGLPFFKMTPLSFVQDMTLLMKDAYTPYQIKANLIDLCVNLLRSPYYKVELSTPEFARAIQDFSEGIHSIQDKSWQVVLRNKEHDLVKLHQELHPKPLKTAGEMPVANTVINEEKIEEIRKAILSGDKKKMRELAENLAQILPSFQAPYFVSIPYSDIINDYDKAIKNCALAFNQVTKLLDKKFMFSLFDANDLPEHKETVKANYRKFISYIVKKSFNLGDFQSACSFSAYIAESPSKKIGTMFDEMPRYPTYKAYIEKNYKNNAMIPIYDALLKDIAMTFEEVGAISLTDRVGFLQKSYEIFNENQRRADFFLQQK